MDHRKSEKKIGWEPAPPFRELIEWMAESDLRELKGKQEIIPRDLHPPITRRAFA